MTALLIRFFVKDYTMVEKQSVRTSYSLLASVVGMICNVLLFAVKLTIGLIINSISVTTDAFNNLSDAASSVISFIGARFAGRPADKEHPFGHGRFEYISALVVSFLILQVGISCFKSSLEKIFNPEALSFNFLSVGFLIISILVKIWMGIFNKNLGERINSTVLKATSADSFSDAGITAAAVLSIIISGVTGFNLDGIAGVIVSIFVLIAGINTLKDTIKPLLGEAVDPKVYKEITDIVESYENIIGSHDLIVHNYGPSHTMATIHAEVPNTLDMEIAHETIDQIERDMLKNHNIFLVIHMDPVAVNNQMIDRYKSKLVEIVMNLEEKASIHDFRLVIGENHKNLIFDLVVPHSYTEEEEEHVIELVKNDIIKYDPGCHCVITLEHSYIAEE